MSNSFNYQQPIPAYSGITINITNPTLNAAPLQGCYPPPPNFQVLNNNKDPNMYVTQPYTGEIYPNAYYSKAEVTQQQLAKQTDNQYYESENKQYQNSDIKSESDKYAYNELQQYKDSNVENVNDKYIDNEQQYQVSNTENKQNQAKESEYNSMNSADNNAYITKATERVDEKYAKDQTSTNDSKNVVNNDRANINDSSVEKVFVEKSEYVTDPQAQAYSSVAQSRETYAQDNDNDNTQKYVYPAPYYINNNYSSGPKNSSVSQDSTASQEQNNTDMTAVTQQQTTDTNTYQQQYKQTPGSLNNAQTEYPYNQEYSDNKSDEQDMSLSQEIISELDARSEEEKELEKNGKKVKVVALTNEYIMSLENYLNNPNTDIRLMAAKDILTRLNEDRDRYDDAALNALLNKMLQDPAKLIRIAALSALSADLASGNDYTVQILNRIQQDPNSDQEDILEVSQILLNRSASTETRYIRVDNPQQQVEE